MATKYGNNIDLSQNEIQNAKFQNLTSAPSSPVDGQFYFNTTIAQFQFWDGTAWLKLSDLSATGIKTLYESNADTNEFNDAEKTKLSGIEESADVTDSTNVSGAGAVMNTDTSTVSMDFVIDEDDMISDSPTKIPTQQSVKKYVDDKVVSSVDYKGSYNASTNTPDLDTSPSGVLKGDMYTVTVAGTFFATNVEAGDVLIAEIDGASIEADWTIVNKNLDDASIKVAYENNANTNAFTDSEQTKLSGIEELAEVNNISDVNAGDLTDSGDSTLHYHASDRARANHTGTQLVSTISDFQTGVSANTNLIAKTDKYAETIGDATNTSFVVTHSLNSQEVIIQIREIASPYAVILTDIEMTSVNTVTIRFSTAPTSGQYRVIVTG